MARKPIETLGVAAPRVTRDEATELCVHHLRLAAMYFQATHEDNNKQLEEEITRQCADDDCARLSALSWAGVIYSIYEEMKDRD